MERDFAPGFVWLVSITPSPPRLRSEEPLFMAPFSFVIFRLTRWWHYP